MFVALCGVGLQDACFEHTKTRVGELVRRFPEATARLLDSMANDSNRDKLLTHAEHLRAAIVQLGWVQLQEPAHGNVTTRVVLSTFVSHCLEADDVDYGPEIVGALRIHLSLGLDDTQLSAAHAIRHFAHSSTRYQDDFVGVAPSMGGDLTHALVSRILNAPTTRTDVKAACLGALYSIIRHNGSAARKASDDGVVAVLFGVICCSAAAPTVVTGAIDVLTALIRAVPMGDEDEGILAEQVRKNAGVMARLLSSLLVDLSADTACLSPSAIRLIKCMSRMYDLEVAVSYTTAIGEALMLALLPHLRTDLIRDFVVDLCAGALVNGYYRNHRENFILVASGIAKCLGDDKDPTLQMFASDVVRETFDRTRRSRLVLITHGVLGALVQNLSAADVGVRGHACDALKEVMGDCPNDMAEMLFAIGADRAIIKAICSSTSKLTTAGASSLVMCLLNMMTYENDDGRACRACPEAEGLVRTLNCFSHPSNTNEEFRENARELLKLFYEDRDDEADADGLFETMKPLDAFPLDQCCSVCHERGPVATVCTPCTHVFHATCLKTWVDKTDTCPICRTPVFRALQKLLVRDD